MIEYPKYKKVLFCTDFSESSDCAFDYAFGIAKRDEGFLYIIHVISTNPHASYLDQVMTKDYWDELKVTMQEDLDKKYEEQYLSQIKDKTKVKAVTKTGREDEEILKFAMEEDIDIIVIGTHGRTGIEHLFIGSIAEKIVRLSPIPVFMVPCKKKSGLDSPRWIPRRTE